MSGPIVKYYPDTCLDALTKTKRSSVKAGGPRAELRTYDLSDKKK
jgi:hypothetical protein